MLNSNQWVPIASPVTIYPENTEYPISFVGNPSITNTSSGTQTTTFYSDEFLDFTNIENLTISYKNTGATTGTKKVTVDVLGTDETILATNSKSGTSTGSYGVIVDTSGVTGYGRIRIILAATRESSNITITINEVKFLTK